MCANELKTFLFRNRLVKEPMKQRQECPKYVRKKKNTPSCSREIQYSRGDDVVDYPQPRKNIPYKAAVTLGKKAPFRPGSAAARPPSESSEEEEGDELEVESTDEERYAAKEGAGKRKTTGKFCFGRG